MTLNDLAETATATDPIALSADEARDIVALAEDADERALTLTDRNRELEDENSALRAENKVLRDELAGRNRELASIRERLHAALYPQAAS